MYCRPVCEDSIFVAEHPATCNGAMAYGFTNTFSQGTCAHEKDLLSSLAIGQEFGPSYPSSTAGRANTDQTMAEELEQTACSQEPLNGINSVIPKSEGFWVNYW